MGDQPKKKFGLRDFWMEGPLLWIFGALGASWDSFTRGSWGLLPNKAVKDHLWVPHWVPHWLSQWVPRWVPRGFLDLQQKEGLPFPPGCFTILEGRKKNWGNH